MLRTFLQLPAAERRTVVALSVLLPAAALLFRLVPWQHASRMASSARLRLWASSRVDPARVAALAQRVALHLPGRPKCLARATAVTMLLRGHGLDARLCMGARPHDEQLDAHAWVELDGVPLAEDPGVRSRYPTLTPAVRGGSR